MNAQFQQWFQYLENYLFSPLPKQLFTYELKNISEERKHINQAPELTHFANICNYFSKERPFIGKVSKDPHDLLLTQQALNLISDNFTEPYFRELCSAEILAKIAAYRTWNPNKSIFLPDGPREEYIIDEIFDIWQGMPAFGLRPLHTSDHPPILLIRGTDFSLTSKKSIASLITDLDPKGPGLSAFLSARESIQNWLKKVGTLIKPRVIGFSLGGAMAAYLSIYDHDLLNAHPSYPSLAFNSPGISKELCKKWNSIPKGAKPSFHFLVSEGDVISKIGSLFSEAYLLSLPFSLPPITIHVTLMLAQSICIINPIDIEKENLSKTRLT